MDAPESSSSLATLLAMNVEQRRQYVHKLRADFAASKKLSSLSQNELRDFVERVREQNSENHYGTNVGEQPERMRSTLGSSMLGTEGVIFTEPIASPPAQRAASTATSYRTQDNTRILAAARPAPFFL